MKSSDVYPSKYLKSEELDNDLTVTIKSIDLEKLESKDGSMQEKPVVYFQEIQKGFVLNKTNWSLIARQHGDESDEWPGHKITLFVMDVEAFGDIVSAIRVRPPRKTVPKVEGVKKGLEVEQDGELITKYWLAVKAFGLDKKKGLQILAENKNDFASALRFLESDDVPR